MVRYASRPAARLHLYYEYSYRVLSLYLYYPVLRDSILPRYTHPQ